MLNGLRDGIGQMQYSNGMIYVGQWLRGKQSGKVIMAVISPYFCSTF